MNERITQAFPEQGHTSPYLRKSFNGWRRSGTNSVFPPDLVALMKTAKIVEVWQIDSTGHALTTTDIKRAFTAGSVWGAKGMKKVMTQLANLSFAESAQSVAEIQRDCRLYAFYRKSAPNVAGVRAGGPVFTTIKQIMGQRARTSLSTLPTAHSTSRAYGRSRVGTALFDACNVVHLTSVRDAALSALIQPIPENLSRDDPMYQDYDRTGFSRPVAQRKLKKDICGTLCELGVDLPAQIDVQAHDISRRQPQPKPPIRIDYPKDWSLLSDPTCPKPVWSFTARVGFDSRKQRDAAMPGIERYASTLKQCNIYRGHTRAHINVCHVSLSYTVIPRILSKAPAFCTLPSTYTETSPYEGTLKLWFDNSRRQTKGVAEWIDPLGELGFHRDVSCPDMFLKMLAGEEHIPYVMQPIRKGLKEVLKMTWRLGSGAYVRVTHMILVGDHHLLCIATQTPSAPSDHRSPFTVSRASSFARDPYQFRRVYLDSDYRPIDMKHTTYAPPVTSQPPHFSSWCSSVPCQPRDRHKHCHPFCPVPAYEVQVARETKVSAPGGAGGRGAEEMKEEQEEEVQEEEEEEEEEDEEDAEEDRQPFPMRCMYYTMGHVREAFINMYTFIRSRFDVQTHHLNQKIEHRVTNTHLKESMAEVTLIYKKAWRLPIMCREDTVLSDMLIVAPLMHNSHQLALIVMWLLLRWVIPEDSKERKSWIKVLQNVTAMYSIGKFNLSASKTRELIYGFPNNFGALIRSNTQYRKYAIMPLVVSQLISIYYARDSRSARMELANDILSLLNHILTVDLSATFGGKAPKRRNDHRNHADSTYHHDAVAVTPVHHCHLSCRSVSLSQTLEEAAEASFKSDQRAQAAIGSQINLGAEIAFLDRKEGRRLKVPRHSRASLHAAKWKAGGVIQDIVVCVCFHRMLTFFRKMGTKEDGKVESLNDDEMGVDDDDETNGDWFTLQRDRDIYGDDLGDGVPIARVAFRSHIRDLHPKHRASVLVLPSRDLFYKTGKFGSRLREAIESRGELPERYCKCSKVQCTCNHTVAGDLMVICGCADACDVTSGPRNITRKNRDTDSQKPTLQLIAPAYRVRAAMTIFRIWKLYKKRYRLERKDARESFYEKAWGDANEAWERIQTQSNTKVCYERLRERERVNCRY